MYLAWDRTGKRQLACKIINRIPNVHVDEVRGAHGLSLNKKGKDQHGRKRPEAFDKQFREFKILQAVNHVRFSSPYSRVFQLTLRQPNIVSLEKVFWSDHTMCAEQDYAPSSLRTDPSDISSPS